MKKLIFSFLILFFTSANANQSVTGNIVYFGNWPPGLLIALDVSRANPAQCSQDSFYILPHSDSDFVGLMRAQLLEAEINGGTVNLVISGSDCIDDRPVIAAVISPVD